MERGRGLDERCVREGASAGSAQGVRASAECRLGCSDLLVVAQVRLAVLARDAGRPRVVGRRGRWLLEEHLRSTHTQTRSGV